MPDITMCVPKICPVKEECYRHRAKPNYYRQAYADFSVDLEGGQCSSFIAILNREIEKLKEKQDAF